jgi:hypothetical protein
MIPNIKKTKIYVIIGLLVLSGLMFVISTLQLAPDTVTETQCTQCTLSKCNKGNTFLGISYIIMIILVMYVTLLEKKEYDEEKLKYEPY